MMISVTEWLFLLETILVIVAVILSKIEKRHCPRTTCTARLTKRSRGKHREKSVIIPGAIQPTQFSLRYLRIATNNFSDQNKIGNGGFGCVYKGIIGGRIVAIKRMIASSLIDVDKEISLLSSFENDNVVKLLGFCSEADSHLLVYEYAENGDIANFLSDETKRRALDWATRFNIIMGIAKGLFYLHHGSDHQIIIHCDVKPENILLDDYYNAKIADFGLSRILQKNKTHVTDRNVAGTPGYIAPELWFEQRYSTRSDVYSYGLLILEILVGCTIRQYAKSNQTNLVHAVWKQYRMKKPLTDIVDSCLMDKSFQDQVSRCIKIGLLCVQHNYQKRPSMEAVLQMLCSETQLPAPSSPAFLQESQSSEESTGQFQPPCLCMEPRKPNAATASPVPYIPAGFITSTERHALEILWLMKNSMTIPIWGLAKQYFH